RILRDVASRGIPVLVVSSDGIELEGLCDRVIVLSRGQAVAELAGEQVTEEEIARRIVTATTQRRRGAHDLRSRAERLRSFARGDYAPSAIVALVIVLLA